MLRLARSQRRLPVVRRVLPIQRRYATGTPPPTQQKSSQRHQQSRRNNFRRGDNQRRNTPVLLNVQKRRQIVEEAASEGKISKKIHQLALDLLDEKGETERDTNFTAVPGIYISVFGSLLAQDRIKEAMVVLNESKENLHFVPPMMYQKLITTCDRIGLSSTALKAFEELEKQGTPPSPYALAGLLFLFRDKPEYALELCERCEKLGTPTDRCMDNLLLIHANLDNEEIAEDFVEQLRKSPKPFRSITLYALCRMYRRAGKHEKIIELSKKRGFFGYPASIDLLWAYIALEDLDKTLELAEKMQRTYGQLDSGFWKLLLDSLMKCGSIKALQKQATNATKSKNLEAALAIQICHYFLDKDEEFARKFFEQCQEYEILSPDIDFDNSREHFVDYHIPSKLLDVLEEDDFDQVNSLLERTTNLKITLPPGHYFRIKRKTLRHTVREFSDNNQPVDVLAEELVV